MAAECGFLNETGVAQRSMRTKGRTGEVPTDDCCRQQRVPGGRVDFSSGDTENQTGKTERRSK